MRVVNPVTRAALVALISIGTAQAGELTAAEAMARLRALAGSWAGEELPMAGADREPAAAPTPVTQEFRVVSAGSVVMETQFQGTDHEMINMYHLDGDELVLTHYCAAGNQPTMRLDRAASTPDRLVFEFTGGTNLDPAVDGHIHSGVITFLDQRHLDSAWTSFAAGRPVGMARFSLERAASR